MGIIRNLTLATDDGTVLHAGSDIALARQWAEHDNGPDAWAAMSRGQRSATVADALAAIRRAYRAHDES